MDLSSLVLKVANNLSDIPQEYADPTVILNSLEKAKAFIDLIKSDLASEPALRMCMEVLASYYTYISWTSLVEQQLGEIPYSTMVKANSMLAIARSFLQLISKYPLSEDLTIDLTKLNGTVFVSDKSTSIINDKYRVGS